MTEQDAKKLEVQTKWNGKANVCVHCGDVPETFYTVTGLDLQDDEIRWCRCREIVVAPTARIQQLEAENTDYKQALGELGVTPEEARKGAERSREIHAKLVALQAENEALQLYKNLTEEYGLSVFEDIAMLKQDAERYRFIRDTKDSTGELANAFRLLNEWHAKSADIDTAIDAARGVK